LLENIAFASVSLVAITSVLLININDWRFRVAALAVQYFGVFFLISLSWPVAMAVSKLVAGWISGAVLGMALVSNPTAGEHTQKKGQNPPSRFPAFLYFLHIRSVNVFYFLAALLVGLFSLSISAEVKSWIPGIQIEQIWAGLLLLGMGLIHLGFRVDPFSTILGLLTILSGFEIMYAVVEQSTLVAGLLSVINLGLALVGAYLILSPHMDEEEG
jgi:hypothetical protein